MGTCSGCNALFKNTHSIQASGDTFCYSVRSSKCNSAEEETFLRADGAKPEEGQVDKGDMWRWGGGVDCTRELCQRETEGQGLNFFLCGYCKPGFLPCEPCTSYTCHSGIKDEMLTRQTANHAVHSHFLHCTFHSLLPRLKSSR